MTGAKFLLIDDNDFVFNRNEKQDFLVHQGREAAKASKGRVFRIYKLVWEGVAPVNGVAEKHG